MLIEVHFRIRRFRDARWGLSPGVDTGGKPGDAGGVVTKRCSFFDGR